MTEFEQEARGLASDQAIKIEKEGGDAAKQSAIVWYGRERIKSDDIVVWLLELVGSTLSLAVNTVRRI